MRHLINLILQVILDNWIMNTDDKENIEINSVESFSSDVIINACLFLILMSY